MPGRNGGRRPKLDALHALEGTVKRNANRAKTGYAPSQMPTIGEPFTAAHLMDDAKACIEIIRGSMPPGVYSKLDSFLLASFSTAWAIHKKAVEQIASADFEWMVERITGPADNERSHWEPNAWIRISNNQAQLMSSLGDRLGLDPKSRAAIAPLAESKKRGSKFDGLVSVRLPADQEPIGSSPSLSA